MVPSHVPDLHVATTVDVDVHDCDLVRSGYVGRPIGLERANPIHHVGDAPLTALVSGLDDLALGPLVTRHLPGDSHDQYPPPKAMLRILLSASRGAI